MKKLIINIVILLVLIAIAVAIFLYPITNVDGSTKYLPLYSRVKVAKAEMDSSMEKLEFIEAKIKEVKNRLEALRNGPVQRKYTVNDVQWKLNIPNLLIYLDKGAVENSVTLAINYRQPESSKPIVQEKVEEAVQPEVEANSEDSKNQSDKKETAKDSSEDKNKKQQENNPQQSEVIESQQNDFKNYILPISITGEYENIVKFIEYCNRTTFVVPYSIHLEIVDDNDNMKANEVKAEIVLRVLYIGE